MAKLPNAERAQVDERKLTGYVLDPSHRTGRHKARVFAAVFAMTAADAPALRAALLRAARAQEAEQVREDTHGVHYAIEFTMQFGDRTGRVRSLWTVRTGEDHPRFVTAFVAKQDEADG